MYGSYGSHIPAPRRAARLACVAGLSAALVLGGVTAGAFPARAYAASAQTMSELSRLQGEVDAAASTYTQATARADELNEQVHAIADEVLSIEQEQLPVYQQKASQAASDLYKMRSGASNTAAMLLTANSFSDFLTMSKYYTTIQDDSVDALNELNELEDELNAKLADLSQAKTEAEAEQQKAQDALAQAKNAAAQMQQKANAENAAEAEAARKAAEKAAALEAQQNAGDGNGSGATAQTPSAPQTPSQGGGSGNGGTSSGNSDSNGGGSQPSTPDQGGWLSGVASYYGIGDGFMGGTTASGDKVTETSMGVAMLNVPLGTRVEIRYRGKSVIAVVNDRGPYAHGRVMDMQPAVARALGFLSVGVDTVQYRFL